MPDPIAYWGQHKAPLTGCVRSPSGMITTYSLGAWGAEPTSEALAAASLAQINLAWGGQRLRNYQEAPSWSSMQVPPTNWAGAYLKAAYWTAVAARIAGSRALAVSAYTLQMKGAASSIPGGSLATSGLSDILNGAAATVHGYATGPTAGAVIGVVAILRRMAVPAELAARSAAAPNVFQSAIQAGTSAVQAGTSALTEAQEAAKRAAEMAVFIQKLAIGAAAVTAVGVVGYAVYQRRK